MESLKNAAKIYAPKPTKIHFFFAAFQESYHQLQEQLKEQGIEIQFAQATEICEADLQSYKSDDQTLVVIDDSTVSSLSSMKLAHCFTVSRHYNVSFCLISHSLFSPCPASRLINQNSYYFVLMRSARLRGQVCSLGTQIGARALLLDAYDNESARATYGHVCVDLHALTPLLLRIRSNFFGEHQFVHVPKL